MNTTVNGDDSAALIELALQPTGKPLAPADLFTDTTIDDILLRISRHVGVLADELPRDMSVEANRKAVASLAYKVARSKTAIDDVGKAYVAELKKRPGEIDALRKKARDRLDALRDRIRAPVDEWERQQREAEEAELRRVREEREARERAEREELERQQRELREQQEAIARERAELERLRMEHVARTAPPTVTVTHEPGLPAGTVEAMERTFASLKPADDFADDFAEEEAREGLMVERRDTLDRVSGEILSAVERKRQINRDAHAALMRECGLDEDTAQRVLFRIIHGLIPNISITY